MLLGADSITGPDLDSAKSLWETHHTTRFTSSGPPRSARTSRKPGKGEKGSGKGGLVRQKEGDASSRLFREVGEAF